MKHLIFTAIFLAGVAGFIPSCASPPEWKEFSPQGDGFSVQMPGEPRQMSFRFNDEDDGENVEFQYYRAKTPGHRYYVLYSNVIEPEDLDEFMDVGFQMKWGDWEYEDTDILYNGHSGKEMTFRGKHSTIISRTYIIDDKLYQLSVKYRIKKLISNDVEKFFNSFTVSESFQESQ